MNAMIKIRNLVKQFGPITAVDDVSFDVNKGDVLGFLGPNGAGKSTTMRMITGYLPIDSGNVSVCGFDTVVHPIETRERIGYLPESAALYPEMKVRAFLNFIGSMRGLSGKQRGVAVDRVIDLCQLKGVVRQTIGTLSKGYRHRTCFAQALIHDPEILILDEPTDGLDPNQKHEMRNLIKEMGRDKAIIISTHILEEVDAVCSRVAIIDRGNMIFDGGIAELLAKGDGAAILLKVAIDHGKYLAESLYQMSEIRNIDVISEEEDAVVLQIGVKSHVEEVAGRVSKHCFDLGWEVLEIRTIAPRLDKIFRELTLGEGS